MSMIGEYARLTPAELERAVRDPDWAREFIGELAETEPGEGAGASQGRCFDTDKAWHALDFLLRRLAFPVDVVFGEEEIPRADGWGHGPPCFLTPERVRAAAEAFAATPPEALVSGVTPDDLVQADIYPEIVWVGDESLDYVTNYYRALVPFFQAAARDGHAMVIWIG
ncbi:MULTISPECIES: YfbM family protein [unclassified Streptomyces]|uniref:YfbM family protein n=1 Tax=unclassified Streptomyces TaxID=2593676 RepID=UPI00336A904A